MALAIDQPLRAADMLEVRDLKQGKIFLLSGRDGSKLVLKAEAQVTGDKVKAVSAVVKSIDRSARMKALTRSEVMELQKFLAVKDEYVKMIESLIKSGYNWPAPDAEKQSVANLKSCIANFGQAGQGGRTNITKMSYAQMSTLQAAVDLDKDPNNAAAWSEARDVFPRFAKALKKSGGFEKLGQIVAGDFFIGNLDRFNDQGQGIGLKVNGNLQRFKVIFNLGNIILVKPGKGKRTRMSMLDYMDPNTVWLDINQDLATLEAANKFNEKWPMRVLLDKQGRHKLAENLVSDLNFLLKPEKSLIGFAFGSSHSVKRVEKGMLQGIRGIAKALKGKQAKLSPLLKSYYQQIQHV